MSVSDRLGRVEPFAKEVVGEFQEENVTFLAGSIAYQAFVSLIPLLVLLFVVVSLFGDAALVDRLVSMAPQSAQDLLRDALSGSASGAGTSIIGLVTLVWGTLKIFRGLDTAFSEIYDTEGENSIVDQLKDGLVVLAGIGGAIVAAAGTTSLVAFFSWVPFVEYAGPLLLLGILMLAFLPMFYLFPDVDLDWGEVLPGVVVAAVGWTLLQTLFQIYVGFAGKTDSYGVLGAILLLLTWLYFGGMVLLLGAVVNAVVAGRRGDVDLGDDIVESDEAGEQDGTADGEAEDTREWPEEWERPAATDRATVETTGATVTRATPRTTGDADEGPERSGPDRATAEPGSVEALRVERETLRRRNRDLRRELRWREKPLWARLVWRALGYRSTRQ